MAEGMRQSRQKSHPNLAIRFQTLPPPGALILSGNTNFYPLNKPVSGRQAGARRKRRRHRKRTRRLPEKEKSVEPLHPVSHPARESLAVDRYSGPRPKA